MQIILIFVAVINLKTMISMRKLRLFAMAAMAAISLSAMAQVTYGNDYGYRPTNSKIYGSDNEGFGLFYIQYNPSKYHAKAKSTHGELEAGTDNQTWNALSLGYSYYIPLGDIPLFIAPGVAAQWYFYSDKTSYMNELYYGDNYNVEQEVKCNMISAKIPINLMYSFEISDAFRIEPYAGVYGRINIWGEDKVEETMGGEKMSESLNLFDKDDMGEYLKWKRFQFGWNAGVNFRITDAFTIGAGYYMDLTKVVDASHNGSELKTNFQGFDITLGVNF